MAGIGFKLRRYTDEGSYYSILKGYTYSAIIVAGPWLILVLALGLMSLLAHGEMGLFHVTIMYVFSFSLIFLGFSQFVITRYLADKLYVGEIDKHLPTFLGALLITLVPQGIIGGLFLLTVAAPPPFKVAAFITYLAINAIWVALLFMGVLRAYEWVVWAFLAGGATSLAAGLGLGRLHAQVGYMAGFALGQIVILGILIWLLLAEFPWKKAIDFEFLSYYRRFPMLALLGFVYYLSTWIDKFIYRASEKGVLVAPAFLYAAPEYEVAHYVAQLTIVPALALFFIRVETDFFERYQEFFAAIAQHQPLSVIEEQKEKIIQSVRSGIRAIINLQGTLSLVAVLLTPQLFRLLYLSDPHYMLLRVTLVGAFFQTFLFIVVVLMLYFECYRDALISSCVFLVANGGLTWAILRWWPRLSGWGFGIAAFVAFVFALVRFLAVLRNLPEITFMKQVSGPQIADAGRLVHAGGVALYHVAPASRPKYEWHA